jgi:hypothetical protein
MACTLKQHGAQHYVGIPEAVEKGGVGDAHSRRGDRAHGVIGLPARSRPC